MFTIRTDLALEAREISGASPGISETEYMRAGCHVDRIKILDERGAKAIGRPEGDYITVSLPEDAANDFPRFNETVEVIAGELRALLPDGVGEVLVAGLGNIQITPDSLGPKVVSQIMVTRHIVSFGGEEMKALRSVSAVSPGVLGVTGVETGEILQGICQKTGPSCLIAIDALASRRIARLCRTVQLADTGIVPGSGVGNRRFAINAETMGIPVIAVGVPTVVDAATLASDIVRDSGQSIDDQRLKEYDAGLIVTPREIDSQIAFVSKLVAYSVNMALQRQISIEDIDLFLS